MTGVEHAILATSCLAAFFYAGKYMGKKEKVEDIINSLPEDVLSSYFSTIGGLRDFTQTHSPESFFIMLTLTPYSERDMNAEAVKEYIMTNVLSLTVLNRKLKKSMRLNQKILLYIEVKNH